MLRIVPLLFILFPFVTVGEPESDKLVIYTHDFEPYHYMDQQQLVGINLDLIVMALNEAGVDFEFQPLNWARSLSLLESESDVALLSVIRTAKREPKYQWVGPLVSSHTCLYRLRSRGDIQARNLKAAKNYTTGLLRGGHIHQLLSDNGFEDGSQLIPLANVMDTYRMLEKGRVDLIPGSPVTAPYYLQKAGMSHSQLTEAFCLPDSGDANYLALSQTVDVHFSRRLNKVLARMREQGVYEQVAGQYQR